MSGCKHGNAIVACDVCRNEWRAHGGFTRAFWESYYDNATSKPVPTPVDRGWQCPVCSAVWAPFHTGCDNCTGKKS